MLPISQKSCPSAQPKQPPSISTPSFPKSTGQDSYFPAQPSVPETVQPLPLSNSFVPTDKKNVSEMESTFLTLVIQPADPQIESNSVSVAVNPLTLN